MMRIAQRVAFVLMPLIWCFSLSGQPTSPTSIIDQAETYRQEGRYKLADSILLNQRPSTPDSFYWAIELARIRLIIDQKQWAGFAKAKQNFTRTFPAESFPLLNAQWLNVQGLEREESGDYETARQFYFTCLDLRRAHLGDQHPLVANAYNNIGNLYYRVAMYDHSVQMHQKALAIRQKLFSPPHLALASSYNNLASSYYAMGFFAEAQNYHADALSIRRKLLPPDHPLIAASLNNLGNCWLALQQPNRALEAHREALAIRKKSKLDAATAQSHNNLGNTFAALNLPQSALFHYREALKLRTRIYGPESVPVVQAQANLGNYLLQQGDMGPAKDILENAILNLQLLGHSGSFLADVQVNYARVLYYMNDLTAAQAQLQEAQQFYVAILGNSHPKTIETFTLAGNIAASQEEWSLALQQYQLAEWGLKSSSTGNTLALIRNRSNQALVYLQTNQFQPALERLRSARQLYHESNLDPHPIGITLETNWLKMYRLTQRMEEGIAYLLEHPEPVSWSNLSPIGYIGYVLEAGRLYAAAGQAPKALVMFRKGSDVLEQQISHFLSQESQRQLANWQFVLFEEAMYNCWQLHNDFPTKGYADSAFLWSERYRNLLFQNQLGPIQYNGAVGEQIQSLTSRITEMERFNYEGRLPDSANQKQWQLQLLQLKARRRDLAEPFKKTIRNKFSPVEWSALRARLASQDQGLLSYFFGENHHFWLYLDGERIVFDTLTPGFDYTGRIIRLRDGINNFMRSQQEAYYTLYAQNYVTSATQLYEKVLDIPAQTIGKLPRRLVILPDGPLYFLPFDLLLESPIDSNRLLQFHRYPYAVRTHSFSYQQSARQWIQQSTRKRKAAGYWLGMAPLFNGHSPELPPLRHNDQEVRDIRARLGRTRLFTGLEATRAAFERSVTQAKIIHLATHGQADPESGQFSYLAFAKPNDSTQQKLYARELQLMHIPADLVVLSACQTGLGSYQRGEGLVSLTKAFLEAGAASTLTTLWSIDDEKSSALMVLFYDYLLAGYPLDVALQKARLDFLDTYRGEYAHPFFWAAYVPQGDMTPLHIPTALPSYWYWGPGLLILLAVFIFFIIRNRRS